MTITRRSTDQASCDVFWNRRCVIVQMLAAVSNLLFGVNAFDINHRSLASQVSAVVHERSLLWAVLGSINQNSIAEINSIARCMLYFIFVLAGF